MSEKILNESEFRWDNLRERIKSLVSKYPEYKDAFSSVVDDTRKEQQDLKREIVFQKVRSLEAYKNIKNEYDTFTNGQRKRIQLALWFRGNLVDGIFWERMFIALKTLPDDKKAYTLKQLANVDENGKNLEEYNKIIAQLWLTTPEKVKEVQSSLNKEAKKVNIEVDGELWPITLKAIKESLDKKWIQITWATSWDNTLSVETSKVEPLRGVEPSPVKPVSVPKSVEVTIPLPSNIPALTWEELTRQIQQSASKDKKVTELLDTTAEDITHRAVGNRGPISPTPVNETPKVSSPEIQIWVIPQINISDINASIQREIQKMKDGNIQKIKEKLGIQEWDVIEKKENKEEVYYVIIGSDKSKKWEIKSDDGEKYFLAKLLHNEKKWQVLSSQVEFNALTKEDKVKIWRLLWIDVSKLKSKELYAKFKDSDLSKLFNLEELSNTTKIEDEEFIKLFSNIGIEKWDIIFTNEEGVTFVYNNNTKKLLVRKDTDFPLESNYEKFSVMKQEFWKLKPQEKQKLFFAFWIDNLETDFPSFYEKVMNKDLFQSIESLRDITEGKVFSDKDMSDSKFGLLKYGIDGAVMKELGIQSGDFYRYDVKTKKLIIFRQSNNGVKEEIGSEIIIKKAFSLKNINAIKTLVALEAWNKNFILTFRETIRKNREYARKEIFFNLPLSLAGGNTSNGRTINFHGSKELLNIITPYDLFGDYQYLKMNGVMYKRAPENGDEKDGEFEEVKTLEERANTGDFYSNSGSKMKLSRDKIWIITDIPDSEIQVFERNFDIDTLLRVLGNLKNIKKQKEFITFIKSSIRVWWLSSQMREKFLSSNPFETFFEKITLQGGNQNIWKLHPLLKESLTVYEFFGDKPYIKVDNILYKNDGNTFRDQYWNEVKKLSEVKNISLQVESRESDSFKDIIGFMRSGDFRSLESFALTLPPDIRKTFSNNLKQIIQSLWLQSNLRETFLKDGVFSVEKGTFMENLLSTKELFAPNEKYIKVDKDIYIANGDGTYSSLTNERTLKLVSWMKLEIVKNIEGLLYTPLAREFWKYSVRRFSYWKKLATGTTGCGKGTWDTLTNFGVRGFTMEEFWSSRDGYLWKWVLDESVESWQMIRVKVNHPDEAKAGAIIPYNKGALLWTKNRRLYWHVEIKGEDGMYRHANAMSVAAGSSHTSEKNPAKYMKLTGFYGYVYYPVRKSS